MSEELIIPEKPKHLAQAGTTSAEEFTGGLGGGMSLPALSIRSKQFRARLDGQEHEMGTELEVIVVAARPSVSKRYFASQYTPGSNDAPDCSSIDGKTPDVAEPVSPTCASCPNNVFGSGTGNGKACADYKRIVVLPLVKGSPVNSPVVLDVPATSLRTPKELRNGTYMMLREYMSALSRHEIDPTTAVSTLSFTGADYPQLAWQFSRYVNEQELGFVRELREREDVKEVLGEDVQPGDTPSAEAPSQPAPHGEFAPQAEPAPAKAPEPAQVWIHDPVNEKVWQGADNAVPDGCKVVSEDKAQKLKAVYEDDGGSEPAPAAEPAPAQEPAPEANSSAEATSESEESSGNADDDVMAEVNKLLGEME